MRLETRTRMLPVDYQKRPNGRTSFTCDERGGVGRGEDIPVYRQRATIDLVGATDRGCFRRQSVDSHILRAQKGLDR